MNYRLRLFHAIGLYLGKDAPCLRKIVAAHMEENRDDFRHYRVGTDEEFNAYIADIREGREWGDHIEIEIIQRVSGRPIIILQPNRDPIIPDNIAEYPTNVEPIFLFREGVHYDALLLEEELTGREILREIQERLDAGESVYSIKNSRLAQSSEHSHNIVPGTNTTATDIDEGGAPVGVKARLNNLVSTATAEPNLQENAPPTNNRHIATVTTSEIRDKDQKKGSQETVGANADDVESDKIPLKLPADADLPENKEEEKAAKLEETDGRLDSELLDSSSIEHPQIKFIRRSHSDGYLSSRSSSPVTVNTAKSPHVSLSIFTAKDRFVVDEDHFDQRTGVNDLQATKCMRYLNSEHGKELEKQRIAIDTNILAYSAKIDRLSRFIRRKEGG